MSLNHRSATRGEYGHRLLPTLVDELAQITPNYVFACIPRSAQFEDGLKDVTISTFARAVDRTAFWIERILGKSPDFETIAYIGPSQSCLWQDRDYR